MRPICFNFNLKVSFSNVLLVLMAEQLLCKQPERVFTERIHQSEGHRETNIHGE